MGRHSKPCQWTGCPKAANLRDLDTEQDFCLGCALAMLYAGDDPITHWVEFDGASEYATEFYRRGTVERLMRRQG